MLIYLLSIDASHFSLSQKLALLGCIVLAFMVVACVFLIILWQLLKKLHPRLVAYRSLILSTGRPLFILFVLTGLYQGLWIFSFSSKAVHYIERVFFILVVLLILRSLLNITNVSGKIFRDKAKETENVYMTLLLDLLVPTAKTLLWLIAILFMLDNILHFEIGTLLAGAGVASMAIAFAAQNTIANLFGAVTLIMDKPFLSGEKIRVDGKEGYVKAIGLRSVTLLSVDGSVWSIPNKAMAETSIENLSRRPFYRYQYVINLTYSHTPEQMQKAKELMIEILKGHPLIQEAGRAPIVTFDNFGAYSLDLHVRCWIKASDQETFMKVKDDLNLEILNTYNENGFDFAFPTQSICVEKLPLQNPDCSETNNLISKEKIS